VLGLICQSADSLPGPTRRSRYHIVWRCIDIRPGEYWRLLPGASSLQHVAGAKRQGGRSYDFRFRPHPSPTSPPSKASPYPCLPTLQSVLWLLGLLRLRGPVAQSGERRPRMAEVTSSSLVGSTSFLRYFAGKNLRESCRSRTLLVALCSNAARAEARTRLLHWPPSRASIVAFALG
jgi:hypothetical protein